MVCAAYYSVSVKYLAARYAPLSLIALQGLSGTLFFGPFLFSLVYRKSMIQMHCLTFSS